LDELEKDEAVETVVLNMPPNRKRAKGRNDSDHRAERRTPSKAPAAVAPVLLLSVEEAARSLSIGRSKTYELIAEGSLEAVHIGRSTRVSVSALHDFLDRLREAQ
jgi:excisionase family DNA binding protein